MSRLFVIEPEAEDEVFSSADWYEQHNPEARSAFLDAINRVLRLIQDHPEQYQVVYRKLRMAPVDGFPYALFYRVTDEQIIVVSCFHTSRNPKIWRDRLR